jgi:Ras-related protein Rab-8A
VLVIDFADRDSFNRIEYWNNRINTEFRQNICKVLVANKIDLPKLRAFNPVEAHKLAKDYGFIGYYEVSANENINVDKAIEDLIQTIYFNFGYSLSNISKEVKNTTLDFINRSKT